MSFALEGSFTGIAVYDLCPDIHIILLAAPFTLFAPGLINARLHFFSTFSCSIVPGIDTGTGTTQGTGKLFRLFFDCMFFLHLD